MARSTPIRPARADELAVVIAIDDDASRRFAEWGLDVELPADYVAVERGYFASALAAGGVYFAENDAGEAIGVAVLRKVDGAPYLEQLSVRMGEMGRGVGRALLAHALGWARSLGGDLLLTTYAHVPWNRPFYDRAGFVLVPEADWGPELRATVDAERRSLPDPGERVVMRHRLPSAAST